MRLFRHRRPRPRTNLLKRIGSHFKLPSRLTRALAARLKRLHVPKPVKKILHALGVILHPVAQVYHAISAQLYRYMPKGLYTRALLILIIPMIILQSVLTLIFMDRHYALVTDHLSEAVVREIAGVVYVLEHYPNDDDYKKVTELAGSALDLSITILPPDPLPAPKPKPFFDLIDRNLSEQISSRIKKPFWIDTVGRSRYVEIRIQLKDKVLRILARRSQTYASNSHIFIVWMVSTSLVLLIISIVFLRNQIRPIEKLAGAAESFGKGRPIENFRPTGAREVRRASYAFIEMRRRIERQIDQRTTMLAGVSHDLRTILTRFRLQLELIGDSPEKAGLKRDVTEMTHMLEDYLAFTRGDGNETPIPTDVALMLEELEEKAEISADVTATATYEGDPEVILRPHAVKRSLDNLVSNAAKFAKTIEIHGRQADGWLTVTVDDDGPGIPEEEIENVFKPFYRLDLSRNQNTSGSGLGLAIARDIARSHGGDIQLDISPLGGLRARFRIPV